MDSDLTVETAKFTSLKNLYVYNCSDVKKL